MQTTGRLARAALALALLWTSAACAPSVHRLRPLQLEEREVVHRTGTETVHHLRFRSSPSQEVVAYLRTPAGEGPYPAVVLVSGRNTGREAAAVIPGPLEEVVLALEYPDAIPDESTAGRWLSRLPGIRNSAFRMPGLMRGAARWLAEQPEVDSARIALVGVSFGVPFAAAAGRDPIFQGVALHHGGADLRLLLRGNLPIRQPLLRDVAARFGAWWLRGLEPARNVGRIPTPVLLINAEEDHLIPRRSAMRLHRAASEPVRAIWLPQPHLTPRDTATMRELADSTFRHFDFLRPEEGPS